MKSDDRKHAENLRQALLMLKSSGPNGFEGLLGVILGSVTGQTFRLAKSGSQRGRDGDTAFDSGATYFEGKRYQKSPKPKEINAKLYDLLNDDAGQVDLWVLGSTCEIASQVVTDLRGFSARTGIGVVLLDWSDNDLGALLISIVAANEKAKEFIGGNLRTISQVQLVADALAAIDHFAKHPDLPDRLESLRRNLSAEEVGLVHAKILNREWLTDVLSSGDSARNEFGQPLAPLDIRGVRPVTRSMEAQLKNAFTGQPIGEIYAVVGDEGVGKSWLTVATWLATDPASILVISPAGDLPPPDKSWDFETFLIDKLIRQTGGQRTERMLERWRRRIKIWRDNPKPENVRITMVFDGLNQPLRTDWSRCLNHAASELSKMGGCLIITTRSAHWIRLKDTITCKVVEVPVGQWSVAEVKGILQGRGIDAANVKQEVIQSLCNPRIFGIAMDLFTNGDVEHIAQLSVGRLMFDHMRRAQATGAVPMSGLEFAELLKGLADVYMVRLERKQTDDLHLFNSKQHDRLEDVASCRFFAQVKSSGEQYEIKKEGLSLGLALYLVDTLERELRNNRNPSEQLAMILEPITALDETANIVFLAAQVSCLNKDVSLEVKEAVLEHFVLLQNLPNSEFEAFAVLVRAAASSFLKASENIYCSNLHIPNADWLLYALLQYRDNPEVWEEISRTIKRWLAMYSLAPERMMVEPPKTNAEGEASEERMKRQAHIDDKLSVLTETEKRYKDAKLILSDRWRLDVLHRTAFYLLAGKPLTGFADDFLNWSFSNALGPAIEAADKEFRQLIRFNHVDWKETRASLLEGIKRFDVSRSSTVGNWTTVQILRATGDLKDAERAEGIAELLTRDREKFGRWSLVENYCKVDPCNPNSQKPENVDETALSYGTLDPSNLANDMYQKSEDHFFDMARTGVVRFHLDEAVKAHRALADEVLHRTDFARRQGTLALLEHSALLTNQQARDFLVFGQTNTSDQRDRRDEWITAQYSIYMAIPHLSADEQLEAIVGIEGTPLLLRLLETLRPASSNSAEQVLEHVLKSKEYSKQNAVLAAIRYSQSALSSRSKFRVAEMFESSDAGVRVQALGVIAASGDRNLLKMVVDSGWHLQHARSKTESWYGSSAILEAAKIGLLDHHEALDRIDPSYYGFAAEVLDAGAAKTIAKCVDAALVTAMRFRSNVNLPKMTMLTPRATNAGPPLISFHDLLSGQDIANEPGSFFDTADKYNELQDRTGQTIEKFDEQITKADAKLVLSDLTLDGMRALVDGDKEACKRWLDMMTSATEDQLRHLHHVAIQIAVALPKEVGSEEFLERLMAIHPTINRTIGTASVPAESVALWNHVESPVLRNICKQRLISRRSDHDIALEVLAAYLGGNTEVVEETVEELLATEQPVDACLALTLAGYSDENDFAKRIFARFEGAKGYVGIAKNSAREAYERNLWARSWYCQMQSAKTPLEFWQGSVLFTKIVDARFAIWADKIEEKTDVFNAFYPTIHSKVERRIQKWQSKRRLKLFGDEVPNSQFLASKVR